MKRLAMMVVASVAVMGLATSALAQAAGPKGGGGLQQGGKGQAGQRQGGGMRMMGGGRMEEQILPKLKLSGDQKKKWDAVNKEMQTEMEKIRASMQKAGGAQGQGQGQRQRMSEEDRTKMMAKFKAFNDKKMAILTKTQKDLYEKEMKAARDKFMKERGGQGGRPGGAAGGNAGGKAGGKTGGGKGGGL